eukprot:TRINITY_DN3113_c0_g1_i2.p1 TRINITY_DN3113_c0_g1~~TRINITY_DN3113_c0_g1_i2.p1  ORF type:complete len:249 (+),score=17.11 TRINITY_DN3113_c0_g1_i2:34-747(+)
MTVRQLIGSSAGPSALETYRRCFGCNRWQTPDRFPPNTDAESPCVDCLNSGQTITPSFGGRQTARGGAGRHRRRQTARPVVVHSGRFTEPKETEGPLVSSAAIIPPTTFPDTQSNFSSPEAQTIRVLIQTLKQIMEQQTSEHISSYAPIPPFPTASANHPCASSVLLAPNSATLWSSVLQQCSTDKAASVAGASFMEPSGWPQQMPLPTDTATPFIQAPLTTPSVGGNQWWNPTIHR